MVNWVPAGGETRMDEAVRIIVNKVMTKQGY